MTEWRVGFYRTETTSEVVEANDYEEAIDKAYANVDGDWQVDFCEEV